MTAPNFVIANLREHRGELLTLNVAYLSWVFAEVESHFAVRPADIIGMDVIHYVESVLDKICDYTAPEGVFCLVQRDGQFVGMGGLRGLTAELVEIKRIFVLPEFRGARLGEAILLRLMQDAARFGYKRVCLETAPFMKTAHRIYEAAGFVDRQPYPAAEVPEIFHRDWRFMERPLQLSSET
ncbi:MAG TPA: GNAT family N-acetyltransferase [Nitrospiraceae bacterium]|nr:GNAT family N-acetyltransferase [Nitrospiraceae bacterium]